MQSDPMLVSSYLDPTMHSHRGVQQYKSLPKFIWSVKPFQSHVPAGRVHIRVPKIPRTHLRGY